MTNSLIDLTFVDSDFGAEGLPEDNVLGCTFSSASASCPANAASVSRPTSAISTSRSVYAASTPTTSC